MAADSVVAALSHNSILIVDCISSTPSTSIILLWTLHECVRLVVTTVMLMKIFFRFTIPFRTYVYGSVRLRVCIQTERERYLILRRQPSVIHHAQANSLTICIQSRRYYEEYCFAHFCSIANQWNEEAAAVAAAAATTVNTIFFFISFFHAYFARLRFYVIWVCSVFMPMHTAKHNNNFNTFINLYGKWFIEHAHATPTTST